MVEMIVVGTLGFGAGLIAYHFRAQKVLLQQQLLKEKLELQEKLHQESGEKLELKLKEFSQRILEEKSKTLREDSLRGMELILNPFRERMLDF